MARPQKGPEKKAGAEGKEVRGAGKVPQHAGALHFGPISIFAFHFLFTRFAYLRWIRSGDAIQNALTKSRFRQIVGLFLRETCYKYDM